MKRIKQHIPNAITCMNLVCGVVGIVFAFQGNLSIAPYLVWAALCFDFLDGFVARMLNIQNKIGKDLDSLADMVTFGVYPGLIMYNLMLKVTCDPTKCTGLISSEFFPYISFLIIIMSAMRLAKFNVDTRQTDSFLGVPTPTNAMFLASLPLIAEKYDFYAQFVYNPQFLLIITLVTSYLLVSEIPLLSFKMKNFKFEGENNFRWLYVISSVILYIIFPYGSIPIIIIWYIVISIIRNFIYKRKTI